jgi:Tir chaperone protein (CesT) family
MDVSTLQSWIAALGYDATPEGAATLRIQPRTAVEPFPPFFLQLSDNWVLLSMLPMLGRSAYHAEDLSRRLLAANRSMRLAKFALDGSGAVVLCAELPTESLDASEIAAAVQRMIEYAGRFAAEFVRRPG